MQNPTNQQHAVQLLNQLDPGQLAAVVQLLEVMISHDVDGDTLSLAERKAIAEADEWLEHNEPIPHEQVLADLSLTMDDWKKMANTPFPDEPTRHNG